MSLKEDRFLISPHRCVSVNTPPNKRAAKRVLHPKEIKGGRKP